MPFPTSAPLKPLRKPTTTPQITPLARPATPNRTLALKLISAYRSLLADELPKRFGVVLSVSDKINGPLLEQCGFEALKTSSVNPDGTTTTFAPSRFRKEYGPLFALDPTTPDKKLSKPHILKVLLAAQRLNQLCISFDETWGIRSGLLVLDSVPVDVAIASNEEEWKKVEAWCKKRGREIVTTEGVVYGKEEEKK